MLDPERGERLNHTPSWRAGSWTVGSCGTSTPRPPAAGSRRCSRRCWPTAAARCRHPLAGPRRDPDFFRITKRLHNLLHGSPGDGGPLGDAERALYERSSPATSTTLKARVRAGRHRAPARPADRRAGSRGCVRAGAHVVWRCHIGRDTPTEHTDAAGLPRALPRGRPTPCLLPRRLRPPDGSIGDQLVDHPPVAGPVQRQERRPRPADVDAALARPGWWRRPGRRAAWCSPGATARPAVRAHPGLSSTATDGARRRPARAPGEPVGPAQGHGRGAAAFADHLARLPDDVHLMLVGPEVIGVSDDPEGAEVLAECVDLGSSCRPGQQRDPPVLPADGRRRRERPPGQRPAAPRRRGRPEEPRRGLRADRHRADVEGPTGRRLPVGGIQDQIVDGVSGLLLDDPSDLDGFADLLVTVLEDDDLAAAARGGRSGAGARPVPRRPPPDPVRRPVRADLPLTGPPCEGHPLRTRRPP